MDLNAGTQQVFSLSDVTGAGGGSIINSFSSAAVLTLAPTSGSTIFSGVISGGGTLGAISLVMNGPGGEMILAGSNTYTGPTTITAGTLAVNGSLAAASGVSVGTAATLAGSGLVGGNTTLTGNGVINLSGGTLGGTLGVTSGLWNGTGSVAGALTSNGQFTIAGGASLATINLAPLNVNSGTVAVNGAFERRRPAHR